MKQEIESYFKEKYEKASFRVVHGHWPDFKSKEEVDKWFKSMELLGEYFEEDK